MSTWAWIQPGDRVWKVVSDYQRGLISVYDEKNNLLIRHDNLSPRAISLIEENFLETIATNLSNEKPEPEGNNVRTGKPPPDNPMYQ